MIARATYRFRTSLRSPHRALALAGAALLAGCYSTATLHTARPVAPGKTQVGFALGSFLGEDDGDAATLATVEGQLRRGVSERMDAGVHVTSLGNVAFDVNYALLLTEGQALSVDPTVELSTGTYVWLPVLWDFYTTDALVLTASVRGGRYWTELDGDEDFLLDELEQDAWLYGAGLAARVRVSDSLSLVPEVRVTRVDVDELGELAELISVSLGVVF